MNIHQGKGYICPGSQAQQKKKTTTSKQRYVREDQTLVVGAEGEEGDWASAGVSGSP